MDNFFDFIELRAEEKPLGDLHIFGLDVETTGIRSDIHEIIEIGIARLDVHSSKVHPVYQSFVQPVQPLQAHITEITGIKQTDLQEAPAVHEVAESILRTITGSLVVAHNADFDVSFLKKAFGTDVLAAHDVAILDTLKLARMLVSSERYSLGYLIETLHLPSGQFHRAAGDAAMCLHLFNYLIKLQPELLEKNCIEVTTSYS